MIHMLKRISSKQAAAHVKAVITAAEAAAATDTNAATAAAAVATLHPFFTYFAFVLLIYRLPFVLVCEIRLEDFSGGVVVVVVVVVINRGRLIHREGAITLWMWRGRSNADRRGTNFMSL